MEGALLPRSIRWRIQLGLLQLPEETTTTSCTLGNVAETNRNRLALQRKEYDDLVAKHEIHRVIQHACIVEDPDGFVVTKEEGVAESEQKGSDPLLHPTVNGEQASQNGARAATLDPLTAMVVEQEKQEKRLHDLDLKYRKERARRKFGIHEGEKVIQDDSPADGSDRFDTYSSTLTLGVIEKDLKRLQPDHSTYHHSRMSYRAQDGVSVAFEGSALDRNKMLTEILLAYSKEHRAIGYRQGMHEIASYLLLVCEIDLFEQESSTALTRRESAKGILEEEYIKQDAYQMLKKVMQGLSPAYDVKATPSDSAPMEAMAHSILTKIRDVASDKQLFDYLARMNCPPELYCTRWVRLMFSREVEGWSNVLLLWDVFFDLVSVNGSITSMDPSKYTRPGVQPPLVVGNFPLMQVLEATAASMILLCRTKLFDAEDSNESIHTLMNVAPLKNILPLKATLLSVMRRIQLHDRDESESSTKKLASSFVQMAQNSFSQLQISDPASSIKKSLDSMNNMIQTHLAEGEENGKQQGTAAERQTTHLRGSQIRSSQQGSRRATEGIVSKSKPSGAARPTSQSLLPSSSVSKASELADKLDKSLATLRVYLQTIDAKTGNGANAVHPVPPHVWGALEDVDLVRKDLAGTATANSCSGKKS